MTTSSPALVRGIAATCALCGYLLFFRLHDIDESFAMLGEQVRDWSMALRRFGDLPLAGPRSLNSGLDIGPAYYWVLWLGRVLLAPVLGNFPHTGAWVISLLQTGADFCLVLALWRRLESWPLAAAIVFLCGSSAFDAGLSASVWNPPVGVAFAKLATASLLWYETPSTSTSVLTIVCAWLALQMHVSAIVVVIPLTLWIVLAAARTRDSTRITACVVSLAASALLVALPLAFTPIDPSQPGGVVESLRAFAAAPMARLRLADSAAAVLGALDGILLAPFDAGWLPWAIAATGVFLLVTRPMSALTMASAVPVGTAVCIYSLWQKEFSELYWFIVIAPAGAICAIAPARALGSQAATWIGAALLVVIALMQPARAEMAWTRFRLPEYGPILRGMQSVAQRGRAVRSVETTFAVPAGMDPLFLLSLAGGRLDASSEFVAVVQSDGSVQFRTLR